ncbi:hypothetical protein [Salibacterium halotolerans]|uniref:Uncharacterized protein n=1 Tax=Salibacterium halotolerans TaxID=1884432 RepID=A0A1I5PK18_9BACI|nr:hypothetical protein [Salibacterium halotolerans]SFP34482.1 hypothetical protein SAMN05518683_104156 [Salibacterium halotolerans]
MDPLTFIFLWIIFFTILYFVVKGAVKNGMDQSHTHRMMQEYIDAAIPDEAHRKPVDQETFIRIHDFSNKQNIPIDDIIHTPFENIYLMKSGEENQFVHIGERVMLIDQEEVKDEWRDWAERL